MFILKFLNKNNNTFSILIRWETKKYCIDFENFIDFSIYLFILNLCCIAKY